MGKPTTEQLARINQLAKTPLTEDQVYVFTSKMIGDKTIPERFQHVTPNFLRKMADDAQSGVALLLDHSWASWGGIITIPVGRSFNAELKQETDGELALYGDFYMVRGQTLNGINTDDIISAIDAGTLFDTSVGFTVSSMTCDIDGLEYWGGACPHIRGETYDGKLCTVSLNDGSLMENSLVFDGAYPSAGVVAASKTQSDHEHKSTWVLQEDPEALKHADRFLFAFSNKHGLQAFAQQSEPEGVDQVNELEKAQQALSAVTGYLAKVREHLGVASDEAIEGALSALKADAKVGQEYAAKVIDEALAAGVRAVGDAFNTESMKQAFSHLSVGEVEKIRDTYNAQAQAALGGGGQHVVTQGNTELPENPGSNPQAAGEEPDDKFAAARSDAIAALKRQGRGNLLKEAN